MGGVPCWGTLLGRADTHIRHFGLGALLALLRSRLVCGVGNCGLVCLRGDVSVLVRSGRLHSAGVPRRTRSTGRRCWSSLARQLLRMSEPVPRARGCSETSHFGYDPLTRWLWWRLPSNLPHIVFPHLRWPSLRTTIAGPMLRWSGPVLCPRRTRGVTTPCKSTRHGVAWWRPATHTHIGH